MEDVRRTTIDTYNRSAEALSNYFSGIGARTDAIELVIDLAGRPKHARVVEIGCGDGRDAAEIIKRVDWYGGFDVSQNLLEIARRKLPHTNFMLADANTYAFPPNLDIVFAFASLLHLSKNENERLCKRVHGALKPGGIFYVSTKYAPQYEARIKEDVYGRRLFYFYNQKLFREMTVDLFDVVYDEQKIIGDTEWVELAFRKI